MTNSDYLVVSVCIAAIVFCLAVLGTDDGMARCQEVASYDTCVRAVR